MFYLKPDRLLNRLKKAARLSLIARELSKPSSIASSLSCESGQNSVVTGREYAPPTDGSLTGPTRVWRRPRTWSVFLFRSYTINLAPSVLLLCPSLSSDVHPSGPHECRCPLQLRKVTILLLPQGSVFWLRITP